MGPVTVPKPTAVPRRSEPPSSSRPPNWPLPRALSSRVPRPARHYYSSAICSQRPTFRLSRADSVGQTGARSLHPPRSRFIAGRFPRAMARNSANCSTLLINDNGCRDRQVL